MCANRGYEPLLQQRFGPIEYSWQSSRWICRCEFIRTHKNRSTSEIYDDFQGLSGLARSRNLFGICGPENAGGAYCGPRTRSSSSTVVKPWLTLISPSSINDAVPICRAMLVISRMVAPLAVRWRI